MAIHTLKDYVDERLRNLESIISEKKNSISKAPKGCIRYSKNKGRWQYYWRKNKKDKDGTYLRKAQMPVIRLLAQKYYDSEILRCSQRKLRIILSLRKLYENHFLEDVSNDLPEALRNLIVPIDGQAKLSTSEWMNSSYVPKDFYEDTPFYLTDKGEKVRSKSEVLIANLLNRMDILYKYEKPLFLNGIGTVYPDFTIFDQKNLQEIYLEHFGLLDDHDYREKALYKMSCYKMNGYYPGNRLIITYETAKHPLNVALIEQELRYVLGI